MNAKRIAPLYKAFVYDLFMFYGGNNIRGQLINCAGDKQIAVTVYDL